MKLFVALILAFPLFAWAAPKSKSKARMPASAKIYKFDDPANFSFTDTQNMGLNIGSKDCEKLAMANAAFSIADSGECLFSRDSHVWGEVKKGKLVIQKDGGICEFEGTTKVVGPVVIAERKSSKGESVCTIVITRTGRDTLEVDTNDCAAFCSGNARMDVQALLNP